MKRKISNQFFTHYIFIFILVIVATVSAYFLLILTNQLAAGLFMKTDTPQEKSYGMITIILILSRLCKMAAVCKLLTASTGCFFRKVMMCSPKAANCRRVYGIFGVE